MKEIKMEQEKQKIPTLVDMSYVEKREFLRKFAKNTEIEEYIDIVATDVANKLNTQNYSRTFNYVKKFLIDGFLAFEKVKSAQTGEIIDVIEIDSATLIPMVENGHIEYWIQYKDSKMERTLSDNQIIHISYYDDAITPYVSYCERLVRPFNLLRIMENSQIIWNIMNCYPEKVFTIPLSPGISKAAAKEKLFNLMDAYKDNISINEDGNVIINDNNGMPFYKNYFLTSVDEREVKVENLEKQIKFDNIEALNYFNDKLKIASKIPFVELNSVEQRKITYNKFISRISTEFLPIKNLF